MNRHELLRAFRAHPAPPWLYRLWVWDEVHERYAIVYER